MISTGRSPLPVWGSARFRVSFVIWLMAATYLAAHVPFLARTPYDIDGVNFALALHEYDLTKHQPHPPGSPLFVGLGRIARTTIGWVHDDQPSSAVARTLDSAALAVWSACFGALAAFGLFRLFAGLGVSTRGAVFGTAVTLSSPLFWFSGVRPMSDMPGLAVASLALGLIAPFMVGSRLLRRPAEPILDTSYAPMLVGCFFAGLAPGMRIQMAWLTWPAAAMAIALTLRGNRRIALVAVGALVVGLVAWLLPLSLIAGGPAEYWRVLQLQAAEDLAGSQMLAVNFTPRTLVQALQDSFVAPWERPWLGWLVLVAAAVGAARLLARERRLALGLACVFGPYAILHLGFHDTSHVRYALPLVPLVALLATHGLEVFGRRASAGLSLGVVTVSLAIATSAVVPHSRSTAPVYQALDQIRDRLPAAGHDQPVLAMHHSVGLVLRGEPIAARVLPSPERFEWLELAKYWRAGGTAPVWFIASRRRTDLMLVDPASRSKLVSYRYPTTYGTLLAGSRPRSIDWVEIQPPGWVALEGWSLTPEVRGVTVREYQQNRPPTARALIRRRPDEVAILLGGRNLGGPCSTSAMVTMTIDGRDVQRFAARAGESFTRLWRLPAGALTGPGPFAELAVSTDDRAGLGQLVDVAFEQFDIQSAGKAIAGLGAGWFEPEYEPREGISYRWMSERAALTVDAFDRDVTLRVVGESPRRYFTDPSVVQIRVGPHVIATRSLDSDFDFETSVPASLLRTTAGVIEIDASQVFVPHDRSWNGDRRALALRIFSVEARVAASQPMRAAQDRSSSPGLPSS